MYYRLLAGSELILQELMNDWTLQAEFMVHFHWDKFDSVAAKTRVRQSTRERLLIGDSDPVSTLFWGNTLASLVYPISDHPGLGS